MESGLLPCVFTRMCAGMPPGVLSMCFMVAVPPALRWLTGTGPGDECMPLLSFFCAALVPDDSAQTLSSRWAGLGSRRLVEAAASPAHC